MMQLEGREFQHEDDFWQIRNFLRDVFVLNDRLEHSWHVARFDYWRWHFIKTCAYTAPVEEVTLIWEDAAGQIKAVLHPIADNEIRLHIHPSVRSEAMEKQILQEAEPYFKGWMTGGGRLFLPVFAYDHLRQRVLPELGYQKVPGWGNHYHLDLPEVMPQRALHPDFELHSMGGPEAYARRSWASWRAFHPDEPDDDFDGDGSWYSNMQAAPLYRRELDIVAAAKDGEIAAFTTIFYDDTTRSAVCVLVGTAQEHQRKGLGKAVMWEGFRRLKAMGCTWVFATAHDQAADALYGSVLGTYKLTESWVKEIK